MSTPPLASNSGAFRPPKRPPKPLGVYVHFPWCLKKCPYCDFVSFAEERDRIAHKAYADAVLAELRARADALAGKRIGSVFFGGGTPSLWHPDELGRVLAGILEAAGTGTGTGTGADTDSGAANDEIEITVECNPTSLDEERARALLAVGVNRLSVGVQGLDQERLRFLGRLHDPNGGLEALHAALRSGMPRVSGDLIYGVAGAAGSTPGSATSPSSPSSPGAREQRAAEAASEAAVVAATGVSHVSAYSLTIEPGTQFGELARRGRLPIATEDSVAESFFAIEEALGRAGLEHYEISNYARPGHEARHNLGYWRGNDYVGLGCAAFGTLSREDGSAVRYRNAPLPAKYMSAATGGAPAVESEEALDPETRLRERIMLGLRLRDGFDLAAAAEELGLDPWDARRRRAADRLVTQGKLEVDGGRIRLSRSAWVFADGIAAALF